MNFYPVGRAICAVICKVWGRYESIGSENVPKKGGVLLCSNHVSYVDPPAVGAGLSHRNLHFMAKSELFEIPVIGRLIHAVQAFPVKRGTADRGALKKAVDYLQQGEAVAMFPEGMRTMDGNLKNAEPGVGMIVLRAQVPVIPVALVNTEKMLPPHSGFLKFTKVKMVYGKPVQLDDLYGQSGREAVEEVGRRIMAAIGELLEEYRT